MHKWEIYGRKKKLIFVMSKQLVVLLLNTFLEKKVCKIVFFYRTIMQNLKMCKNYFFCSRTKHDMNLQTFQEQWQEWEICSRDTFLHCKRNLRHKSHFPMHWHEIPAWYKILFQQEQKGSAVRQIFLAKCLTIAPPTITNLMDHIM